MTNKDIEDAISKCEWLSDNRPLNLVEGVCTAMIKPCLKAINNGECIALKELFKKEINEDDKQGEANTINEGNVS